MTPSRFVAVFGFGLLSACSRPAGDSSDHGPTGPSRPEAPSGANASPSDEPVLHVPVGEFVAGGRPLEPGREPALEPTQTSIKLGPFRMDREVYPGSAQPPRLVTEPKEAEALCAGHGGRLCTELEWERACKGPASNTYPGGEEPCAEDCPSAFDVLGMGQRLEWTASVFGKGSPLAGQPVLRGTPEAVSPAERRCARRQARSAQGTSASAAFRCCYGAPNAARVSEPQDGRVFEETDLPLDQLKKLLESEEQTRELVQGLGYFKEDAAATVLARGDGETRGFTLTTRPVKWRPERGVELLVACGHSANHTAFVVAYFLGLSPPKLAGSFIMKNERGPIALAYATSIRPRMHFSGCWGCPGETGKLLFRPKEEIVLLQP